VVRAMFMRSSRNSAAPLWLKAPDSRDALATSHASLRRCGGALGRGKGEQTAVGGAGGNLGGLQGAQALCCHQCASSRLLAGSRLLQRRQGWQSPTQCVARSGRLCQAT
jgi:hypothetical protein